MRDEMTPREPVVATLNHEEPDRVPIDFGSNFNTGVNISAYNRLKKHLGISSPTHSRQVIPMLAAPDLDEGLDPALLKREFGEHIAFWGGGIGTQTTLCHGTAEDAREEVKRTLEIFKPGGGYVFTPDHNIQEHVSPEQILAVYETAQEFGRY